MSLINESWKVSVKNISYQLDGIRNTSEQNVGTRILLQGLGCESRIIWSRVINQLEKEEDCRETIAFDVRGVGNSSGFPISFDQMVQDTLEVISKEKAPIQIVGHSLGGLVALRVAEIAKDAVDSIILVCSNPRYSEKSKSGFIWRANFIKDQQNINCIFDKVIPRSFSNSFFKHHPEIILKFKNMLDRQSPNNYSKLSYIAAEADALASFMKIDKPLLMIIGSEDPSITYARTMSFVAKKGCSIQVVEGAGHNVPLEDPVALTKLIRDFDSL